MKKLKNPEKMKTKVMFFLDYLNGNEMNIVRVEAMFERSRHNSLFSFIISRHSYELPKKIIRANKKIYLNFKSNNFGDVQNLYQSP